jgi:hypothetical protein
MRTVTGTHVGKRSVARRAARQTTPATIVKTLERRNWRREEKDKKPENNAGKKHSGVGMHGLATPYSWCDAMDAGDPTLAARSCRRDIIRPFSTYTPLTLKRFRL